MLGRNNMKAIHGVILRHMKNPQMKLKIPFRSAYSTSRLLLNARKGGEQIEKGKARYSKKKIKRMKREQARLEINKYSNLPKVERDQITDPKYAFGHNDATLPEIKKESGQFFELLTAPELPSINEDNKKQFHKLQGLDTTELRTAVLGPTTSENNALVEARPLSINDSIDLLKAYGLQKKKKNILSALREMEMITTTFLPTAVYNAAISGLSFVNHRSQKPDMDAIAAVANRMQELNIQPDIETFENLAYAAATAGELDSAFEILKDVQEHCIRPTLKLWHILISGCNRAQEYRRAWDTFDLMRTRFEEPNTFIYNTMISVCAKQGNPARANNLFIEMEQTGVEMNEFTYHALLHAYARSRKYEMRAHLLYEQMQADTVNINIVTFGTVLFACTQRGDVNRAKAYWEDMMAMNIEPNEYCYNTMLQVYARSNLEGDVPPPSMDGLFREHPTMKENPLSWEQYYGRESIDYEISDTFPVSPDEKDLTKHQKEEYIRQWGGALWQGDTNEDDGVEREQDPDSKFFEPDKKEYRKRLGIHNLPDPMEEKETLQKRNIKEAMALFQDMKKHRNPTLVTLNSLLNVYSYADRINTSMRFLNLYKMHGLRPSTSSFASLIWMLCRNDRLMDACLLKEALPEDVRVTEQMMDTLILYAGKAQDEEIGQALLQEMRDRGMRPPNEAKLRPLRRHLTYLGMQNSNMPADPHAWRKEYHKERKKTFGKKVEKWALYLSNTGFRDMKLSVFNGFGAGKANELFKAKKRVGVK